MLLYEKKTKIRLLFKKRLFLYIQKNKNNNPDKDTKLKKKLTIKPINRERVLKKQGFFLNQKTQAHYSCICLTITNFLNSFNNI
ncbi:hypothetical protein [Helicobacter pylori]|uniref:hypothetical protein n=1 Tax=Helicobacter pylori TaxID=210 RepID=UPI00398D4BF2